MKFIATETNPITNSVFIEEIAYNSASRMMAVRLKNGSILAYQRVNEGDVTDFVNADSVGRWYNRKIKKNFGPSFTVTEIAVRTNVRKDPHPDDHAVSTNKSIDSNVTVTNNVTLGLAPTAPDTRRRHKVTFVLDGNAKVYTSEDIMADNVDEAVKTIKETLGLVNLRIIVREVVTYFE